MLVKDESLAAVLADEAEEARKEVRAWGEREVRKRNLRPPGTIGVAHQKGKRRKSKTATTCRLCETQKEEDRIFGSSQKQARNGSSRMRAKTRLCKHKKKERRDSSCRILRLRGERRIQRYPRIMMDRKKTENGDAAHK